MPLNVVAVPVKDVLMRARQQQRPQGYDYEEHAVSPQRVQIPSPKWSSKISPTLWRQLRRKQGCPSSPSNLAAPSGCVESSSTPQAPVMVKWSPRESYRHGTLYVRPGGVNLAPSLEEDVPPQHVVEKPPDVNVPTPIVDPPRHSMASRRPSSHKSSTTAPAPPHNKLADQRPPKPSPRAQPYSIPGEQFGEVHAQPRSPPADFIAEQPSKPSAHPPHIPRPFVGSSSDIPGPSSSLLEPTATNILPVPPREGSAKSRGSARSNRSGSGIARPWVRMLVMKGLESIKRLDVGTKCPRSQGRGDVASSRRLWTESTEERLTHGGAHACDGKFRCARCSGADRPSHDVSPDDCSTPRHFLLEKTRLHDRVVRHLSSIRPYQNGLEGVSLIDRPNVVSDVIVQQTAYVKPAREAAVLPSPRMHYRAGSAGDLGKPNNAVQRTLLHYKQQVSSAPPPCPV